MKNFEAIRKQLEVNLHDYPNECVLAMQVLNNAIALCERLYPAEKKRIKAAHGVTLSEATYMNDIAALCYNDILTADYTEAVNAINNGFARENVLQDFTARVLHSAIHTKGSALNSCGGIGTECKFNTKTEIGFSKGGKRDVLIPVVRDNNAARTPFNRTLVKAEVKTGDGDIGGLINRYYNGTLESLVLYQPKNSDITYVFPASFIVDLFDKTVIARHQAYIRNGICEIKYQINGIEGCPLFRDIVFKEWKYTRNGYTTEAVERFALEQYAADFKKRSDFKAELTRRINKMERKGHIRNGHTTITGRALEPSSIEIVKQAINDGLNFSDPLHEFFKYE